MHDRLQAAAMSDDSKQDECIYADANVIRQPAGKEGEDKDDCCLQGFALLVAFWMWQLRDYNTVARQDYQTRQDKSYQDMLKSERNQPVLMRVHAITQILSFYFTSTGKNYIRHCEKHSG